MKIKLSKPRPGIRKQKQRRAKLKSPSALAQTSQLDGLSTRLKKILVPIDFSASSVQALRYAVSLAAKFDAVLCLVTVVDKGSFISDLKNAPVFPSEEILVEDAKAKLVITAQKEISRLRPVALQVRVGKPYEEIVQAANRLEADLIIISTHGYTGWKHALLGSTTECVVRYARCPVLVVRERQPELL